MPLITFDLAAIERLRPDFLIGVDEAGRGPLAGPVVAAAAWVPPAARASLEEIDDSKKLDERTRARLLAHMRGRGVRFGFGCAGPEEIDRLNILRATFAAMARAVSRLAASLGAGPEAALVLVDGPHRIKGLAFSQEAVVRGDQRSLSVAAASIFAKVVRDRWMAALDARHPGYGLAAHKGYGTPAHLAALRALGPSPVHRLSFAPVRAAVPAAGGAAAS